VERADALYRAINAGSAKFPSTRLPRTVDGLAKGLWIGACGCGLAAAAAPWLGGIAGTALGTAAGLGIAGLAVWVTGAVVKPLVKLDIALRGLDEGQLARSIEVKGSGLESLFTRAEAMRIHLRATFSDLLVGANVVARQASELRSAVGSLEETSDAQRERVMQVAAAMEQMSVSVSEISGHTSTGMKAASDTEEAARESVATMRSGVASTQRVTEVVEASRDKIAEVDTYITKIGQFAALIKDIAEQTNLLALNAAIEAARAGEQGRGFAVVADEVRKLAERTAQSTTEISAAVTDIVSRSRDAVSTMSSASGAVNESTERITQAENSIGRIMEHSNTAVAVARSIDDMLKQQSAASHEVAVGMEVISDTVDKNHRTVGSIGDASAQLGNAAEELHALVKHLESALG